MSELLEVGAALSRAAHADQVCVLATVVRTEGSTYRRIGARMVLLADGSYAGAVSPGCLESDIALRAADVRAAGNAELLTYDTRSADDLVWGFGLGCGGLTELLLEPLEPEQALARAKRLGAVAASRRTSVLATVIRASGLPLRPGELAVLSDAHAALEGFAGLASPIRALVNATARQVLEAGASAAVHHVRGEQELDVAYEVRAPRVRLCVCGAGPDAAPLVAGAGRMGWQVTLVDHRTALLSAERWPGVDCVLVESPADIAAAVEVADADAAVVMNHHHQRDLEFLEAWLRSSVSYIGMLGPRERTDQMLETLESRGIGTDDARQRVRAPVGLDLGAETAEEIALAIVAEVQAVHAGRGAGFLSRREGPIHGPAQPSPIPETGWTSAPFRNRG